MAKPTAKRLDEGQLEVMWNFLRMGYQKADVATLKELCDRLRQAMIQKTGGQRKDGPAEYIPLGRYRNDSQQHSDRDYGFISQRST